mgnify:CR=1 FL=1
MILDASSLLIAIAFSSASLTLALFIGWLSARTETYLVLTAAGVALVVLAAMILVVQGQDGVMAERLVPFAFLLAGFSLIYAAARHFRNKRTVPGSVFTLALGTILAVALPMLAGLTGLGAGLFNISAALIMALCAREYWRCSDQPRVALLTNAALYGLMSLSFTACTAMLVANGEWVLTTAPQNWAEDLNAVVSLVALTGIGAVTLTLHHARAAHHHLVEANTDALTGVLNRRALFDRFGKGESGGNFAVLMFDLDHFKQINDRLGHAEGDRVLQLFAGVLRDHLRPGDVASRIGGEEFCVVLPGADEKAGAMIAERIRGSFASLALTLGENGPIATVSAGIAVSEAGEDFSSLLNRADAALYQAKHDGRNQVRLAPLRLAA